MHPFTSQRNRTVAALGERRLIEGIRDWLGAANPPAPFGIGDDCAVLRASSRAQLVTVDPVIFGRHFDARVSPEEVGAKLLKRNLSDIAAMGGRPRAAVIGLTLAANTKVAWVEGFYRGLARAAGHFGVPIVGGDVAQGDGVVVASLTLLGEATTGRVLTRTGARNGDWIYVTGELGNTLRSRHHLTFTPRLAEGRWLVRRREVRAMMDLSDGLAKDLWSVTPDAAAPELTASLLPLRAGANPRGALSDGEDYELLLIVDRRADCAGFERAWRRRFPDLALTRIGRFVPRGRVASDAVHLEDYRGFEHLR